MFNARIKTVHGLYENPIKFFLFKQIYFFDILNILHIIRLLILSNFNNLDIKLSFGNQKYIPYFLRIITIMENRYIFQIKAFYLKKLHFNCTFSLDPVSIIYKQGFEEMI